MSVIAVILAPLVWAFTQALQALGSTTGSIGWSIVLLGFAGACLTFPLQRWGHRRERALEGKIALMKAKTSALRAAGLRGEKLFLATEEIYREHNYHPIHAMAGALGFLVTLPLLLTGMLVLTQLSPADCGPFLFVPDLCQPDGLLAGTNLLPVAMFVFSLVDAVLRASTSRGAKARFLFISVVVSALVFNLPAAVVLYWIASNLMSMVLVRLIPARGTGFGQ